MPCTFLLSGLLEKFHYLSKGLSIILAFIGVKLIMQASHKVISTSIPEITLAGQPRSDHRGVGGLDHPEPQETTTGGT